MIVNWMRGLDEFLEVYDEPLKTAGKYKNRNSDKNNHDEDTR